MDTKTLRSKSRVVLIQELEHAQGRLKELRFKRSANQLKDVREIRECKRGIARIKTILASLSSESDKAT